MKDFYYILGTDVNCSSIEIKEAYRKLSKKFHPDLNQNDRYFESHFKEIQEAYDVLNDPFKRKQYDAALNKFKKGQNVNNAGGNTPKVSSSAITKTRRGIDIIFTIVLIAITCIFGDYVIKAINTPEKIKTQQSIVAAIPVLAATKTKHHKKKHVVKPQAIATVPNVIKLIKPVKIDTVKTKPRQAQIAHVEPKPVKIIAVRNSFLYSTMVKANVTGVVNMREQDNLSSDVVEQIPNYSQVDVLEKGERYYKVRYNNSTGYIPKWTLQVK